jgi:hypothetical protein
LAEAYRLQAPDLGEGIGPGPMHPAVLSPPQWWADWAHEIAAAAGFEVPQARRYSWSEIYARDDYLRMLSTHSDHILLGPERLERLLDAVAGVLDRHGGAIELEYATVLWMARASGGAASGPG